MWTNCGSVNVPLATGEASGSLQVGRTGRTHPFSDAQNHVPACYSHVSGLLSPQDVRELQAWFCDPHSDLDTTTFDGEALLSDELADAEGPRVRQLYRRPMPFEQRFGAVFERLLDLKDRIGAAIGLAADEIAEMDFAHDIRHITYLEGHDCPFHCDDPRSTFNIVMMLSRPNVDFGGGTFQVHPGPLLGGGSARSVMLRQGDAIIYTASKVDHGVSAVTEGIRQICLVELRRRSVAFPRVASLVPSLLDAVAVAKADAVAAAQAAAQAAPQAAAQAAAPPPSAADETVERAGALVADTAAAKKRGTAFRAAFLHDRARPDRRWQLMVQLQRQGLQARCWTFVSASAAGTAAGTAAARAERSHRKLWASVATWAETAPNLPSAFLRPSLGLPLTFDALRRRWATDAPPLLVLEAGATLCDGFRARAATLARALARHLPAPSERTLVLCLGGEASEWVAKGPRGGLLRGQQRLREAEGVQRVCAYLVYPAAARELLRADEERGGAAGLDDTHQPDTADHCSTPREDLALGEVLSARVRDQVVRAFVAVPALAWWGA